MKVVILAGGLGTRIMEETVRRPKPMVEICGQPILWHILKIYAHYGFREFVIALGYQGDSIKRYFINYFHENGSLRLNFNDGQVDAVREHGDNWLVHLVDTGLYTQTGGRLRRLKSWLGDETFMLTYGDGVGDIDLNGLLAFHRSQARIGTITAVKPPARFGGLVFDGGLVANFTEKPVTGEGWINGGFMVFEPEIFRYLDSDATILERDALETLAGEGELAAHRHESFWQCMDHLHDKQRLDTLCRDGLAPWKVWEDEPEGMPLLRGG